VFVIFVHDREGLPGFAITVVCFDLLTQVIVGLLLTFFRLVLGYSQLPAQINTSVWRHIGLQAREHYNRKRKI